ncbi:hypothetical protein D7X33_48800 [Butyricicoccus sp. 1XD8-22]|nr:hypothetical protein D7X33_48800 [Butyricicoccus sp. 1XD8-22]
MGSTIVYHIYNDGEYSAYKFPLPAKDAIKAAINQLIYGISSPEKFKDVNVMEGQKDYSFLLPNNELMWVEKNK